MSSTRAPHVAIVGAGPCGLACGRELALLGHDDWAIYEREPVAGGHAGSTVDAAAMVRPDMSLKPVGASFRAQIRVARRQAAALAAKR